MNENNILNTNVYLTNLMEVSNVTVFLPHHIENFKIMQQIIVESVYFTFFRSQYFHL